MPLAPGAAFDLFTAGMSGWWPTGLSLRAPQGAADDAATSLDPRPEGRWTERAGAGEAPVGSVATWDPPRLVALAWHPGADDGRDGRVEVRFAPVEDDLTTVIVEHHLSDATGRHGADRRWLAGEQGWWGVLRAYVAAARSAAGPQSS